MLNQGAVLSSTASSVLARELNIRVADSVVSRQCISTAKGLFLRTQVAVHLLLLGVVDRILVPCQVVRSREDGVAGLASARIDAIAAVRSGLAVEQAGSHADVVVVLLLLLLTSTSQCVRLPVTLALVLLE